MIQAEAIKCKHCGEFLDASRRPAIQERAASGDSGQQVLVVKPTKSRGVYIILGLLLGCLGIHNFYAGYNGKGATQLIITLILGWVIIGIVITGLWALIDICTVTVDANGDRMT
jgi:TM2 domain-containing membrane protein YozV